MKTKAFLIARVSDPEQKQALPAQVQRLERYAKEKDYDYGKVFQFDESAYKDDRREFMAIVKQIQEYPDKCIVVFDKIDRYTRDSTTQEVKILNTLREEGKIELHFPSDNLYIYKDSPATDLFRLGIGLVLARYYSDTIRDNVKRRFEQKLNDGEWCGMAPIGYLNQRISEKVTSVIVDTQKAPFIIKAFELRAQGMSFRAIAAQMKADGLRNNSSKHNPFGQGHFEKILKNPFYYGVMKYNGKLYKHKYEPLISRKLFNDCQRVNEQQSSSKNKTHPDLAFTFNGLLKCGSCGCSISSYTQKGHTYMKCSKKKGDCQTKHLKESDLMPQIEAALSSIQMTEDIVQFVISELRKHHDNQQLYFYNAIEQTRAEYDTIQKRLHLLYEDRLEGRITTREYDGYVTDYKRRQEELDQQLVDLTGNDKSFIVTSFYLLDIASKAALLFSSSKPALKARLLRFLVSNLEVNGKNLSIKLKTPFDTIAECSQNDNWLRRSGSNRRPNG